eukprot:2641432-Pyramimonas_sp.AAC.1
MRRRGGRGRRRWRMTIILAAFGPSHLRAWVVGLKLLGCLLGYPAGLAGASWGPFGGLLWSL